MPVTLKCSDCGHTEQSDDGEPKTCPECEGTMKKPGYKAKAKSVEAEAKAKPKPKPEPLPEDDEDDAPKKTKPRKAAGLGEEKGSGSTRDGAAAESLELDPGFTNKRLMKQVEEELSRGEVLHWAARPSLPIAKRKAMWTRVGGLVFAAVGGIMTAVILGVAKGGAMFAAIIPGLFVLIGLAILILAPKAIIKQAERGWYAVTNRRAIVFQASLWGDSGQATTYEPSELRRMRVQKSSAVPGGGDLIFRTEVSHHTRTQRDARGRTRTSTSTSTQHFGFMGIENVREVETLIHNILVDRDGRKDEDDDE